MVSGDTANWRFNLTKKWIYSQLAVESSYLLGGVSLSCVFLVAVLWYIVLWIYFLRNSMKYHSDVQVTLESPYIEEGSKEECRAEEEL